MRLGVTVKTRHSTGSMSGRKSRPLAARPGVKSPGTRLMRSAVAEHRPQERIVGRHVPRIRDVLGQAVHLAIKLVAASPLSRTYSYGLRSAQRTALRPSRSG